MLEVIFYIFAGLIVISGIWMVWSRNLIHGAFLFLVILLSLAGIYVLYQATFLAVVQLLVYAGGVVVLLAFGIMLTNRSNTQKPFSGSHLLLPGFLLGASFVILLIYFFQDSIAVEIRSTEGLQISEIGVLLMTDYLLAFELIAYLLLIVLVGATYYAKQARV